MARMPTPRWQNLAAPPLLSPLSEFSSRLSALCSPLSALSSQLSALSSQLSALSLVPRLDPRNPPHLWSNRLGLLPPERPSAPTSQCKIDGRGTLRDRRADRWTGPNRLGPRITSMARMPPPRRQNLAAPPLSDQLSALGSPLSTLLLIRDQVETNLPEGRSLLAGDSARSHRRQAGCSKSHESHLESERESAFRLQRPAPFAYQPTDARPRRGEKKTPGLEDRALNHMEQGSTCSFGGRDHHRG